MMNYCLHVIILIVTILYFFFSVKLPDELNWVDLNATFLSRLHFIVRNSCFHGLIKKVITTLRLRCSATFGTVEPDTDVSRRVRTEIAAPTRAFALVIFATRSSRDRFLFFRGGNSSIWKLETRYKWNVTSNNAKISGMQHGDSTSETNAHVRSY